MASDPVTNLILTRSGGQFDYAAIVATCAFNSNCCACILYLDATLRERSAMSARRSSLREYVAAEGNGDDLRAMTCGGHERGGPSHVLRVCLDDEYVRHASLKGLECHSEAAGVNDGRAFGDEDVGKELAAVFVGLDNENVQTTKLQAGHAAGRIGRARGLRRGNRASLPRALLGGRHPRVRRSGRLEQRKSVRPRR
jgi:hypothetical protein